MKRIPLRALVIELLRRSGGGFIFLVDIHKAVFRFEFVHHLMLGRFFTTPPPAFMRQDWLGECLAVCPDLADALEHLEAARDIAIDRSPLFPLAKHRSPTERLRRSRATLRRKPPVLRVTRPLGDLMDAVIANAARGERNDIGRLSWERMIRASARTPGRNIDPSYAVLIEPCEPVTAREIRLSQVIHRSRVRVRRP